MSRRNRARDDWPVTDADEAAIPRFRREVRVRLLSAVVCLGIPLHLFASIPYNDAQRAVDFVSPWPEIPLAWRNFSRDKADSELRRMAASRPAAYRRGVVYALVVLAFGVFALRVHEERASFGTSRVEKQHEEQSQQRG
ncbi:MAG: hypothetical protein GEV04_04985 [Actinophytocola sp.]|nr:hypothetical protein [Actinophytocola sp.]